MYVSKNMTNEELVLIVHTIEKYDVSKYIVDLQSISIVPSTTCRTFLRNDDDVQFMLREDQVIPQEVDNEANIDLVDHVENSDEEPVQIQRPIQGVSCTGADMPGTSEVRHNVSANDSYNTTTWVITKADSYSFVIGISRTLVAEEPTSMIYKGQFFPTKKDLKRLVGLFAMRQNFKWKVKRSNKTTLHLICFIDNYTWKLRAVSRDEGTYFQGRFGGTMFVATAQDGNEQVYPIALRYGDSENNLSWEWFLDCLKGALGHIDDLVFISDRYASIEIGFSKVFSYATHNICCMHFAENVKKRFHIKDITAIMDKAARAYTELKYNRYMGELRNLHNNAFDYVEAAGPYKWSRVHCPQRRYRVMTTNVAECIHSCLKFALQLPMLTLAEFIRNMLRHWFHYRHQLTDAAHLVMLKSVEKCSYMTINPVDWNIFSVKRFGKQWTVNLARKTCTCNKFQMDHFLCSHALAVARYIKTL
ncbi:hypothetical protein Dsin_008888 [Dipteronia sinensis]|uniref:SWIM-type domain-containing protein n=1 Tax=Dipteronia sinensis TaxID=43782 RepID=A0AAE0APJ8_9ROSI|nr:hypothetical protein Dsin_008888 [Dipteronia sinensis]